MFINHMMIDHTYTYYWEIYFELPHSRDIQSDLDFHYCCYENNPIIGGNLLFYSTCLEDMFQDKAIPKHICIPTAGPCAHSTARYCTLHGL